MAQVMGLKEAERRAFRLSHNDGLWDVLLGCFFLMFVGAPYLSSYLGDFWSSAVFLPFWGLVFAGLVAIRRRVVIPRVGVARFGEHRKAKLRVFSLAMLVVNAALLILGLLAATGVLKIGSPVVPLVLGLVLLAGFSVAGYVLDFSRLYAYGLLAVIVPMAGEWLYVHKHLPHHGWPVAFGALASVAIVTGVVVFVRLLLRNPIPTREQSLDEERHG